VQHKIYMANINSRRYYTLVAVQSLAGQLKAEAAASGSGAPDRARPLFEVMIYTPPTPQQEEFSDNLKSWSGAAEVTFGFILRASFSCCSAVFLRRWKCQAARSCRQLSVRGSTGRSCGLHVMTVLSHQGSRCSPGVYSWRCGRACSSQWKRHLNTVCAERRGTRRGQHTAPQAQGRSQRRRRRWRGSSLAQLGAPAPRLRVRDTCL